MLAGFPVSGPFRVLGFGSYWL